MKAGSEISPAPVGTPEPTPDATPVAGVSR